MKSVELGLMFACVMMVGVAIVMIVNTFLMNVGERRRQLAMLRAIGTTRRQLIRAMLLEGIAMGLVGTLLGSLLGLGGAYLLALGMGRVYSTAMPALRITLGPFLLATVLGPSISLMAMFIPAYVAGKISPLEGMRTIIPEGNGGVTLRSVLFTLIVFAVTGGLLAACITGYLPEQGTIYAGVLFTLATFLAFVPIMLGPMARLASFVLYPLLRIEGQIAQRTGAAPPHADHPDHRRTVCCREHRDQRGNHDPQQRRRYSQLAKQNLQGRLLHPWIYGQPGLG